MKSRNRSHGFILYFAVLALTIAGVYPAQLRADDDKPKSPSALQSEMRSAYRAADYKKALEAAEKLREARPNDNEVIYNIACLHSLLGEKDKAYDALNKAVRAGYRDADHASHDADLRSIWGEERFRKLLKQMRAADRASEDGSDDKPSSAHSSEYGTQPQSEEDSDDDAKDEKPAKTSDDKMTPQEHGRKVEELTQKLIGVSGEGKRDEALKLALEALHHAEAIARKASPEEARGALSLTNYNVACMYALKGEKQKAITYFVKSVDVGFSDVRQIQGDTDLDSIRKEPEFVAAFDKVKKRQEEIRRRQAEAEKAAGPKKVEFKWNVSVPSNLDKSRKAPLIVAMHHFGGTMDRATERWKKAADQVGAILLTPQGTIQMENGRYEWGKDIDTIEDNIMSAIDNVLEKHNIDEDKIVVAGFNQGGMLAWQLAVRNPETFKGAIPVAGRFQPESDSVFTDKELAKLRFYVMVGADDNSDTVDSNKTAAERFEKLGAQVKLNVYEDVGHDFPENDVEEEVKALKFVLGA